MTIEENPIRRFHGSTREQRYANAQMGFCLLDTDLRYLEINEWLAAINGLSPAEHLGRTIGEVLPRIAEVVEKQLRQVMETGEPILNGLAYLETAAHPGVKRIYQHDYYANKSAHGTVSGVTCIVQGITQRRLADVAGIVPWEADARTMDFIYVGPNAEGLLGYPIARWYESGFRKSCIHPDDRDRVFDVGSTQSGPRQEYGLEYRMIKADGDIAWIRDVVSVDSVEGEPIVLRGFMCDISELKESQEQLRTALEEVAELRRRLEQEKV